MNADFNLILTELILAGSLEKALALTLEFFLRFVQADALCILLWDEPLGRYTIGETWVRTESRLSPAEVRRSAMQVDLPLQNAEGEDRFFQPLTLAGQPVGAVVGLGVKSVYFTAEYQRLLPVIAKTLYTMGRLESAEQERREAAANHERLTHLLKAVEQQQRTIDQLLAVERQLSASLEIKVEERTAALKQAQERLIQSEKLAVIGQLATSLAHEINNPLQAIQSGLGLVITDLEKKRTDRALDDLYVIQEELERIESIFRQMLDFYRPVSFEYVPFSINTVCESVAILMRKRLEQAHIHLHLKLNLDLPLTCGDKNQMKQVLLNLMLNAMEATPTTLTLETGCQKRFVWMSVQDDGVGIPEEHQSRIFEPLFTTKMRGLGMGLAISREIVERVGGYIVFESTPFTLFRVYLPVKAVCYE